jgi:IS30 family transposase
VQHLSNKIEMKGAAMKKYTHITDTEKEFIRTSLYWKKSIREIAKSLGRNPSSISREIKKKTTSLGFYLPHTSSKYKWKAKEIIIRKRKTDIPIIRDYLIEHLKKNYSPQIIAARIYRDTGHYINKDTIYKFVYHTMPELTIYLPRKHKGRMRMKYLQNKNRKSLIQNRTDIDLRPTEANERKEFGHFEADTICSPKGGAAALLVVVDRKTRLTRIRKLARKTSQQASSQIIFALNEYNISQLHSITYDNGCEFCGHENVNNLLRIKSYFCKPYHAWEKGTVENINGLIRWFFPKKTNFDTITEQEINEVENWINNRPMRVLGYKSPYEFYNDIMAVAL